jgi:adiponectin receptor
MQTAEPLAWPSSRRRAAPMPPSAASSLPPKTPAAKIKSFDQLHAEGFAYLADNSYIRSGYRLHYTVSECFFSLFELHNETLNVWTHLVGSFIFVSLMAYLTLSTSALGLHATGGVTGLDVAPANAWCHAHQPPQLDVAGGHHTPRLFFAATLPQLCPPRTRGAVVPAATQRRYYQVASVLLEHSLHQIPSLEKFYTVLGENVDDWSHGVAAQMALMQHEITLVKERLSHVTDAAQIVALRESLSHRVEGFSAFLQSIASNVGADVPMKYALDELHGLVDTVKNGIHVIARVDTHHVPHWPIFVFMVSAVICLTCSATFHLLFVYSKPVYFFLSRLDYAGITILIAGSFYPMIYYSFYCHPTILRLYLTAITTMAAITFAITLMPAFSTPKFLVLRTSIFLSLGFFGLVPIGHLIWEYGLFDPHVTVMIGPLVLMGLLYTMGAIIYATRFPERFYPGRFDVLFSSHQLWHIFVVAAALVHFVNAMQHYEWRWNTHCDV